MIVIKSKKPRNIILCIILAGIVAAVVLLLLNSGNEENHAEAPTATSLTAENEDIWLEDNALVSAKETAVGKSRLRYDNCRFFSCPLTNGGELFCGSDAQEDEDSLNLNPVYRDSSDAGYGIYVSCPGADVQFFEGEVAECFIFTGRTYDTLLPCSAVTLTYPDTVDADFEVRLRVVSLSDYMVMGTAVCTVQLRSGHCRITDLKQSDVGKSHESLDNPLRNELVGKAAEYITDRGCGPSFSFLDREYLEMMKEFAIVEKVPLPYFSLLCSSDGSCLSAGALSGMELYAVNLCYLGTGNITVYLAPEYQTRGFGVSETFFSPDKNFMAFAYDFLYPFSAETLLVPEDGV